MRDPAPEPARFSAATLLTGLAVTMAGVATLLAGILAGDGIAVTAAGAAACFIGAALMIGLAVIAGTSVLVSSARATIGQQITAASRTDFYVQATNASSGISPALASTIASQPGVRAVTEVRQSNATVAGATNRTVTGVDPVAPAILVRPD
jgi:hypothetical protein